MPRQFFVGGNFKLNPASLKETDALVDLLNNAKELDPATEIVVAPPALYVISVKEKINKRFKVAAQNSYLANSGAFTGEISPQQLVNAEIPYVILGHSERRTLFKEDSELVGLKTRAALDAHVTDLKGKPLLGNPLGDPLNVIVCVGETAEENEGGAARIAEVLAGQLEPVLAKLVEADWSRIVIAYEPVWAIGTGKVATPTQAQTTHNHIRTQIFKHLSEHIAGAEPSDAKKAAADEAAKNITDNLRIIYGGSVNAANCRELAGPNCPDIDGFLVGGASLKPEFVNIINARKV